MVHLNEVIRQMTASAEAIRTLVQAASDEQAAWKPDPDTWSLQEVMEHLYNEERIDFRQHLVEMFSLPQQPWGAFRPENYIEMQSARQALEWFLTERQASIAWLKTLESPDWDREARAVFGPEDEVLVLKTGDVLLSWVEHDFLHLRQVIELLHAWNEHQASPYSLQYAGGW